MQTVLAILLGALKWLVTLGASRMDKLEADNAIVDVKRDAIEAKREHANKDLSEEMVRVQSPERERQRKEELRRGVTESVEVREDGRRVVTVRHDDWNAGGVRGTGDEKGSG